MHRWNRNLSFLNLHDVSSESRLIFRWNILSPIDSNPSPRVGLTAWKRCCITFADPIRARWHQGHSRPTFIATRAPSSRRERTSVRHRDEKKGRLVNAPPDQGQPRVSIPLPILRRAIGGPSIPTSSNSYAVYFVRLFPPAASPFAHLPPTFPGCLTWSVASSCTRATRTFSERRPTI